MPARTKGAYDLISPTTTWCEGIRDKAVLETRFERRIPLGP